MSQPDVPDVVWKALSSPWRRQILDLLSERPHATGELVLALGSSRHLVLGHLSLLREADLVHTVPRGRIRMNYLNAVPIRQIHDRWVSRYAGAWSDALIGLRDQLERHEEGVPNEVRDVG